VIAPPETGTLANTVEGSFELTLRDVARARLWLLLRNRLLVAVGAVALVWAGWLVFSSLLTYGPSWELLPYVVLLCFWVFVPFSAWMGARQFMRSLVPGQTHQRIRISREGFEQEDGQAFGRSSWETVISAHETIDAFYLRAAGPILRLMPKRAFASRADIESVRHVMRQQLGTRARSSRVRSGGRAGFVVRPRERARTSRRVVLAPTINQNAALFA
jgi:hypothetical protein